MNIDSDMYIDSEIHNRIRYRQIGMYVVFNLTLTLDTVVDRTIHSARTIACYLHLHFITNTTVTRDRCTSLLR